MNRHLFGLRGGVARIQPTNGEVRWTFKHRHNPIYLYNNGQARPYLWKFELWRRTGEYACFYRQRVTGPFGSFTETYVWVLRGGRFVEVEQQGVHGALRRKLVRM